MEIGHTFYSWSTFIGMEAGFLLYVLSSAWISWYIFSTLFTIFWPIKSTLYSVFYIINTPDGNCIPLIQHKWTQRTVYHWARMDGARGYSKSTNMNMVWYKKPCIHSSAQTTLDIPYALHLSNISLHTSWMEALSYANRIYRTNNRGSLQISNLVDSKNSQCFCKETK